MKVFILTTVMAPYRVQLFSEIGKKCELYVCFEQMRSSGRDEKWYDASDANFHLVKLKKWESSLKTIKFDVIKHIRNIRPDVVIAYEYHTNTSLVMLSYCRMNRIPYIINCDGAFVSKSIKDFIKKIYISKANGFISSGSMADKYLLHYGAKKECIYLNHFTSLHKEDILESVPSVEEQSAARKEKNISESKVILSVGQFIYRKGFDVLLRAVKNLPEDVGVYVIGGKVTSEYEQIVRELSLKNVHFIDFVSPDELKKYFIAADVFVLPTREDVWGLVINEAMACGLPVVTTDRCVAGIEIIKNGVNGFLVPVDDHEALAEAINKIIDNEQLQDSMAVEGLNNIRDYTYENSAQDVISVVHYVCDERN